MPIMNDYYLPTKMGGPIGATGPIGIVRARGLIGPAGAVGPIGVTGKPLSEEELREIKRQKLIKERNDKIQKINDKYV